jgi:hypothetical protein
MRNETKEQSKARGKKSRAIGDSFEIRVRNDLEKEGSICDRWTNNIENGKIVPSKPKYVYNPKTKQRQMIRKATGFPDFVAYRWITGDYYSVIGIECKTAGKLDKIEKEKCVWLLKNKIFSKILIATKTKIKNRIKINYTPFHYEKLKNI